MSGVKQPTLQRIEAGLRKAPSVNTIAALAMTLNVTIDNLVGNADSPGEQDNGPFSRLNRLERRIESLERAMKASSSNPDPE